MQTQRRGAVGALERATPPRVRWAGLLGAALLALAQPRVARADPLDGIALRWDGPDSCGDRGEVSTEARRLLPASGAYEPTEIDIVVREREGGPGYLLRFSARSASRSADRELRLASCEEARQAAGLLVALTLDPESVAEGVPAIAPQVAPAAPASPPPAPPVSPEPAAPEPKPVTPPAAAARSPVRSRQAGLELGLELGPELAAGAFADTAVLPDLAFGAFASAGLRVSGLRLSLSGLYLPGAERELAAPDGPRVRATLWAGQLALCQQWQLSATFELGPCASIELGRYAARSERVAHSDEDAALWAASAAGISMAAPVVSGFGLFASLLALVPITRPVLSLSDTGPAYTVPRLSLRAALGVRWN